MEKCKKNNTFIAKCTIVLYTITKIAVYRLTLSVTAEEEEEVISGETFISSS